MCESVHFFGKLQDQLASIRYLKQVRKSFRGVTVIVVSQDLEFLSAFAELADAGRLAVWENRVLVVTRLERQQFLGLMKDLWLFSMLNTMLVNMDDAISDMRCSLRRKYRIVERGYCIKGLKRERENRIEVVVLTVSHCLCLCRFS